MAKPSPALHPDRDTPRAIEALRAAFGPRCQTGEAIRQQHAHQTTWLPAQPPDCVVFAHSTAEVQTTMQIARQYRVPIIPFGTGSSLEGQVNAPQGGISLDLSGMNRILAVNAADFDCVIEPGVTRKQLNEALKSEGLFFPIDPGADASLGGMAATRASGTNAVRYGTMRENVLALEAVMADSRVIKTARRARKTSAGYDLTRLLVGSEGTLGILTQLTLRLSALPEAISGGICPFPDVKSAADAVILTIQSGIPVARIELLDALQVKAVNAYSKLTLPEAPLLLLEFHGSEGSVAEQAASFAEIASEFGGGPFTWTTRPEERTKLWQARHDSYWASRALKPGTLGISTDVCVPISRLAECITQTQADLAQTGLVAPIVGHVGDGNFHCLLLIDETDAQEHEKASAFIARLTKRAQDMDGTCTGEHGIGQGKRGYLERELGEGAIHVMRALKTALDPLGLLNPGKILPEEDTA